MIWWVQAATDGSPLARRLQTRRGRALLLQSPSVQKRACDKDVRIVVHITDPSHARLILPEEFQEPAAWRVLVAEGNEDTLVTAAIFSVSGSTGWVSAGDRNIGVLRCRLVI
jgi:hypothetical protein